MDPGSLEHQFAALISRLCDNPSHRGYNLRGCWQCQANIARAAYRRGFADALEKATRFAETVPEVIQAFRPEE